MRIPAKVDYAIRALTELAAGDDGPVKAEHLADAQEIPLTFLREIFRELRRDRIVRSIRGPEGGFVLDRPAAEITLADVFRAVDGPLAEVRDQSLSAITYHGSATELPVVWQAVRASLRRVLEATTVADLVEGSLPREVVELAEEYRTTTEARWAVGEG